MSVFLQNKKGEEEKERNGGERVGREEDEKGKKLGRKRERQEERRKRRRPLIATCIFQIVGGKTSLKYLWQWLGDHQLLRTGPEEKFLCPVALAFSGTSMIHCLITK